MDTMSFSSSDNFFVMAGHNVKQVVPGWSGFNSFFQKKAPPASVVGHCPVIPAPSTQLDTVYTLLAKSVSRAKLLGQKDVIIAVDQAVYSKALEILWKKPGELQH